MPVWKTTDEAPASNALKEQIYNALDCCITSEVFGVLEKQLDEITAKVYELEKSLQTPVFYMELSGVKVDTSARDDLIRELSQDVALLETSLHEILTEGIGIRLDNPGSPKQLSYLLYDVLGLPPQRSFKTGGTTVDAKALEKLKQYFYAVPIISHIQKIRDLSKQISTLRTSIDHDNRIRTSFNIAGTETGRFSSYASALGSGCVLPSAEVLTKTGWKKIRETVDGDVIAQWDNGEISFVPCKIFKKTFSGKMLKISTEQLCLTVTPGHRVAYRTTNYDKLHTKPAQYTKSLGDIKIPLGGTNVSGEISYPSYLSMLMADFSKEGSGWRGSFKKDRKIERFLKLAKEFNIPFTEQVLNREGYRRFRVIGQEHFPKKWGEWVLSLTEECAKNLLEEARYWDSHDRGSGFIFFTVEKEQAEWFATLAHIAGKSATIRSAVSTDKSYKEGVVMWSVNVKNRNHATVYRKHWEEVPYEGDIYCPIVPSSYWLVREDNFISVTGNSNLQNIDPRLRRIFISDPGMKMAYIDLEQAESRAVGAIEWNLFQNSAYIDACTSADLHTMVSKMCWENLPWTGDVKSDKAIAKEIFFRNLSYRDTAKRLGHGCVTPEHEVLTPSGWVKIYEKPDRIMAFSRDRKSFFSDVSSWTEAFIDEDMYLFAGPFFDQLVTFNHKMIFGEKGSVFELPAEKVPEGISLIAAQVKDEFLQTFSFNKANYEIKKIPYKGMVYCPTVPQTGMFLIRRNGKISVTGNSNYGGKADNMAKETRIDVALVKDFQYRYFKAFPAHKEWHAWVRSKLLKDGFITTFMGRRRTFFGRRWDEDTVKEAIAYEPQSSVADYLNIGMLRVYQSKLCQLLLQIHDAILVQYPAERENEVVPQLRKILEHEVPLMNGRTLVIPTDAEVGWNWGKYDEKKNPNGLKSFSGNDDRKRVEEEDIFSRKFSLV